MHATVFEPDPTLWAASQRDADRFHPGGAVRCGGFAPVTDVSILSTATQALSWRGGGGVGFDGEFRRRCGGAEEAFVAADALLVAQALVLFGETIDLALLFEARFAVPATHHTTA